MSKKMCVRLKFFLKSTRISYSTKNPKNTVRKKMTGPKNIFQGDLRGYYACDAVMIKKKKRKKEREKSVRQKVRRGVKLLKNKTQDHVYIRVRERMGGRGGR